MFRTAVPCWAARAWRRIVPIATLVVAPIAYAQSGVPLGDEVERALTPRAILDADVHLSGSLAYLYRAAEGADIAHLIGDVQVRVGEQRAQRMGSREAVAWLTTDQDENGPYTRLEIYLRDEAAVREPGGTVTIGPVLFVTLATRGRVLVHHDFMTTESSEESPVYREGWAVRDAFRSGMRTESTTPTTTIQVFAPRGDRSGEDEIASVVHYRSRSLSSEIIDDRRVITAIGDVYLYRGKPGSDRFLEIRAQGAVIFFPLQPSEPPPSDPDGRAEPSPAGVDEASTQDQPRPSTSFPMEAMNLRTEAFADFGQGSGTIQGAYLEGDVLLTSARNTIRASRIYYDFEYDKALILDAVVRVDIPDRNIPLYIRADQIRQLSSRHLEASNARFTTSEFYTPHYHVGAGRIELVDRTPTDFSGQRRVPRSGTFTLRDATFNIGGVPVLYWPLIQGDVDEGETSIRGVSVGYSRSFGAEVQTRWRLFSLLGLREPEGFDATLKLDYFSERGPAIGVDGDYRFDDSFGEFKSYLMNDTGEDNLGRGRRNIEPEHETRGRLTWRHREFLPDDWELTFELSYISDRNFLEEYFENEFDNDKDQETLLYLKKQVDNWAFTAHLQYRLMDFVTQTERLPDFSFRLVGQPLADWATLYSEARAGLVRYRTAEIELRDFLLFGRRREESSGITARAETRQDVSLGPLDIGPLRIVPFVAGRAGAWDDTPDEGGADRIMGQYGLRGSMYLWRVYDDVRSTLWDIDGLRHIIKPDFVIWGAHGNLDSDRLYPFDESVERVDEIDGVTLGVRQRWQTHRGQGDNRRITDVFTSDFSIGAFADAPSRYVFDGFTSYSRPENSVSRNYMNHTATWRVNDATALVYEVNYDLNDMEMDRYNVSLVVERLPRLTYLVAYRFINETESNLLGVGVNYQLNEKYTVALRQEVDIDRGSNMDVTLGLMRRYPRWNVIMALSLDEAEDHVGFSMSVTPEGFPAATLGPKRFTGLVESMKISSR